MYVSSKWELKISAQNQSFLSNLCYKIIIIMGQNLLANKSCSSMFYQNYSYQNNRMIPTPFCPHWKDLENEK